MRFEIAAVSFTIIVSLASVQPLPAGAQSLADVARKEEARRKEVAQPSKVISNKDLPSITPATEVVPVAPAASDEAGDKSSDTKTGKATGSEKDGKSAAAKDKTVPPKDAPKDQAYWSGRMKTLQTQLDRDQGYAEALRSRINGLTADFSARDDPAQRSVIGRDRQKALDELDRLTKAIAEDSKAIADLQEEARRSAVPPGWLR